MSSVQMNMLRRVAVGDLIRRTAKRFPQKTALVFGKNNWTYQQFNEQANRFAHAMVELGVGQGDRVAIMSHNCPQFLICFLGLAKIGAVITPLNFALKQNEAEYIITHSEAKVVIVEDALVEVVQGANLPQVKHFIGINLLGKKLEENWIDFDSLLTEKYSDNEPELLIKSDDMVALLYTSGTESVPKGVMGSHLNYYSVLLSVAVDVGLRSDDVFLVSTPLFHVAALTYQALTTLAFGGTVILMYQPSIDKVLELIDAHKVTFISFPSTIYMAMAQVDGVAENDLNSVRVCYTYGAPIPSTTLKRCMELLPGATWINYYGQTELSPLGTGNSAPLANPQSIGIPHLPLEMKIVDGDDKELPRGEVGEIVARGPAVMLGYYKNEDRTKQAFRSGWLHTGDLAKMDEDGNIYFIDRKKDIIKSGGENVSSQEVEEAIFKHPGVAEAAVIGMPDSYWGEAVVAVVVLKQNETLTEKELISHCKELIAGYKVPKKVVFTEHIPKNPSGKMLKRQLRKMFNETASSKALLP